MLLGSREVMIRPEGSRPIAPFSSSLEIPTAPLMPPVPTHGSLPWAHP